MADPGYTPTTSRETSRNQHSHDAVWLKSSELLANPLASCEEPGMFAASSMKSAERPGSLQLSMIWQQQPMLIRKTPKRAVVSVRPQYRAGLWCSMLRPTFRVEVAPRTRIAMALGRLRFGVKLESCTLSSISFFGNALRGWPAWRTSTSHRIPEVHYTQSYSKERFDRVATRR